jgi:hypothetical protein
MYQIVCVREDTDGRFPVASGFSDEAEAWETAQGWINRRFRDAAYDYSRGCWWLRDVEGYVYRIVVMHTDDLQQEAA